MPLVEKSVIVTCVVAHPKVSKSLSDLLAQKNVVAMACTDAAEKEPGLLSQVLRIPCGEAKCL